MRKLGLVGIMLAGCYGAVGVGVSSNVRVNPVAAVATAVTVAAIVNAVAMAPPMVVDVEYYDSGYRPGYCWVNGRYAYVNNAWAWQGGYWQTDRPGYVWVQGTWTQSGDQYVWADGYWAEPRTGYVYIDGYWDYRDTGYAWIPGRWEVDRPGYVYVGGSWSTTSSAGGPPRLAAGAVGARRRPRRVDALSPHYRRARPPALTHGSMNVPPAPRPSLQRFSGPRA